MRNRVVDSIRRNHSLEHATVSVLLGRGSPTPLGGYSLASGFILWSRESESEVADAVAEALNLLNDGRSELAVSPYCGTNLAVGLVLGVAAAKLIISRRQESGWRARLGGAMVGFLAARAVSRPVGRFIQRRITTLADVSPLEIQSVRTLVGSPLRVVWVSTRSRS